MLSSSTGHHTSLEMTSWLFMAELSATTRASHPETREANICRPPSCHLFLRQYANVAKAIALMTWLKLTRRGVVAAIADCVRAILPSCVYHTEMSYSFAALL